jgi:predicted RND superfamily exporter protein
VDDTIHFVHEYQATRRRGVEHGVAIQRTLREVGPRMVTCSGRTSS